MAKSGIQLRLDVEQKIIDDYRAGVGVKVIAARYQVNIKTVHVVRWRYDVPHRINYSRRPRVDRHSS